MLPDIPKEGERVIFLPLRIKGTVTYVDYKNIYQHHLSPIQVELDEPWDPTTSPQRMIRGSMLEFRKLKKRRKKKGKNDPLGS